MFSFNVSVSDLQMQDMLDCFFEQSDGSVFSILRRPNVDNIPIAIIEEASDIQHSVNRLFELTRPLIVRGLRLLSENNRVTLSHILQDDWDWTSVECLLQYVIYGEELYG